LSPSIDTTNAGTALTITVTTNGSPCLLVGGVPAVTFNVLSAATDGEPNAGHSEDVRGQPNRG
jgi:hypothetical protein